MVREIERDLVKQGIKLNISTFTNHDNFGLIIELARYLKIILKDNYNSISNLEYIKQLDNPTSKKLLQEIFNKVNITSEIITL